jgi:hypothetical protein
MQGNWLWGISRFVEHLKDCSQRVLPRIHVTEIGFNLDIRARE